MDHVLRDLARRQVDEVASLDHERGVDVDTRAFDRRAQDVVRRRHRRTLELLAQVPGERGQHSGELRRTRRAARHPVPVRVETLHRLGIRPDPHARLLEQLRGRGRDLVDEPDPDGIGRVVPLALQQHLHQPVGDAEHAHRPDYAAGARQQAERDFGEAELRRRVVQRDATVTGESDFETAAERRTVQCRDDGLAQRLESAQVGLDLGDALCELRSVLVRHLDEQLEVAAGEEGVLRGRDDHAADRVLLRLEAVDRRRE
jgi:hypothetical protein